MRVDTHEVADGVADNARYDVFQLIDAAMAGEAEKSLRMIKGLKAEGIEIMLILAMLTKELRNLEKMKTELESGQARETVFKNARVWKNRESRVSRCLGRQELEGLRGMIACVGQTDRVVKGQEPGEPWQILEEVFLRLSGKTAIRQLNQT